MAELARVVKPGGRLVVNTPHLKETALRRLRHRLGQTDEKHGHVRPGYTLSELRRLLEPGRFALRAHHTYSRFFTERVDTAIQLGLARLGKKGIRQGHGGDRGGRGRHRTLFRAYSAVYPLVWAVSRLDLLAALAPGYMLIARPRGMAN